MRMLDLAAMDDKKSIGRLLSECGGTTDAIKAAIEKMRGGETVEEPNAEEHRQALEKYTIDLPERAEQGKA